MVVQHLDAHGRPKRDSQSADFPGHVARVWFFHRALFLPGDAAAHSWGDCRMLPCAAGRGLGSVVSIRWSGPLAGAERSRPAARPDAYQSVVVAVWTVADRQAAGDTPGRK